MQTITQLSNESRVLIKGLETQMLALKSEFDLANRSNTSKIRELESLQSTDHTKLKETGDLFEIVMKQVSLGMMQNELCYEYSSSFQISLIR
jgi:hypothetical protein